jgi:hypothetical protein
MTNTHKELVSTKSGARERVEQMEDVGPVCSLRGAFVDGAMGEFERRPEKNWTIAPDGLIFK